jgi:hypothetical protein
MPGEANPHLQNSTSAGDKLERETPVKDGTPDSKELCHTLFKPEASTLPPKPIVARFP